MEQRDHACHLQAQAPCKFSIFIAINRGTAQWHYWCFLTRGAIQPSRGIGYIIWCPGLLGGPVSSPGLQPWHEGSLAWQGGIHSLRTTKHLMFSSQHCWLSNELGLPRQNRSRPPVSSRDVTENLQVPPRPLSAYYKRGFLQTVPGCGAAVQGFSPHRVPLRPLQNFPSYSPQPPSEGGSQHPPSKNHNNPGTLDTHTHHLSLS